MTDSAPQITTLGEIVKAGADGTFVSARLRKLPQWKKLGLVEVGEVDANGMLPIRATAKGAAQGDKPLVFEKPAFEIEEVEELPDARRGRLPGSGAGESVYPFEQLAAPTADGKLSSFFVPDSAVSGETAKGSLAGTVSAANARYSEPTGEMRTVVRKGVETQVPATKQLRKFALRADEKNGVKGARIFRIL